MITDQPKTRRDFVKGLIFLNAVFLILGLLATWRFFDYYEGLMDFVESQAPLFTVQLQQSALIFVWVFVVAVLIVLNIQMIYTKILRKRIPEGLKRIKVAASWSMFLGAALVIFGNQLINPLWEKDFSEAGYTRCETRLLDLGKSFFNAVWVLKPADCYDAELRRILSVDRGERGLERAQHYLDRKHRFLREHAENS